MSDPPADIYEEDENGEVRGRGRGRVNQERGGGGPWSITQIEEKPWLENESQWR